MTQPISLRDLATTAIRTYFSKMARSQKAVLKDRDPEDLHQMRVGLRRLRTAMQVFEPVLVLPKAAQEPQVAAVGRKLGRLRDLDVISDLLQQYLPGLPAAEEQALKPGWRYLRRRRQRVFKQVKAVLKGDRYQRLKTRLKAWTQAPEYSTVAPLSAATVLPDLVGPLLSGLWLHPGWLIATEIQQGQPQLRPNLDPDTIDAYVAQPILHSLRKQVKRVRYQLQLVADQYGDRLDAALAHLQTLQETLGQLQDSLVLADFLETAIPNWQTQLPILKAQLAHSRYQSWGKWQVLQSRYLDPIYREGLRQILETPGAHQPEPTPVQPPPAEQPPQPAVPQASNKPSSGQPSASQPSTGKAKRSRRRTHKPVAIEKPASEA
jgi:CHAD domain-containing protein